MTKNTTSLLMALAGLGVAGSVHAATLMTTFQGTIASEQHPTYAGEARYYHVSVNSSNPGTGSYAATIVGTNNPAPTFVRAFTEPVLSYIFPGGVNNDITSVPAGMGGGNQSLITFTTTDTTFDGFGQQQAKVWSTTDPGVDLQTTAANPFNATADANAGGFRALGGAIGTFDISGLATGTVNFYYGAFNTTPTISAVMRASGGGAPDIVVANAHLNGDLANRTEYYLAELSFVTDGLYDQVVVTWDSDGDGDLTTGNGRGVGAVLTGTPVPEPSSAALVGLGSLGLILRRRRK